MEKKLNLNEVTSEVVEGTEQAASCMDTRTKVIVAAASVLTLGLGVGIFFGIRALRARKNKKAALPEVNDNPEEVPQSKE